MSPNNILNMADLNKLDIVAITDHNTMKQTHIASNLAKKYGFIYIFGCEVTTVEQYHVLCLFKEKEHAIAFERILEREFTAKTQPLETEGQIVFDECDGPLYTLNNNYYEATRFQVAIVREMVDSLQGILILAHIERYSESMIDAIMDHLHLFHAIEINRRSDAKTFLKNHPKVGENLIVRNSDSHRLEQIVSEAESILLPELSIHAFFAYFQGEST